MGAVVGAHHGDWLFSCLITGVQKGGYLSDVAVRFFRACRKISGHSRKLHAFSVHQTVAFLCNGKSRHLQRILGENLLQSSEGCLIVRVQSQGLHHRTNNSLLHGAVCLQRNQNIIIVMRTVHLLHDFIVESLSHHNSTVNDTGIEQILSHIGMKSAEQVPCAKMDPERIFFGLCNGSPTVKLWQLIALFFPLRAIH